MMTTYTECEMKQEFLKYKAFCFDRNFHLLVPNSLRPVQSILASLDPCNQAFLFCNIQLTEQTSQTNQLSS